LLIDLPGVPLRRWPISLRRLPGLSIGVRMSRRVKWAALAVGAIVASGGVLAGAALVVAEHERNRVVQIDVRPVPHAVDPAGRPLPGGPPSWREAPNPTPGEGSALPRCDSPEKLRAMLRSGQQPDGSAVAVMPFETLRDVNDTDVAALPVYLASLPPRRHGGH
jgi:hypothetical protein